MKDLFELEKTNFVTKAILVIPSWKTKNILNHTKVKKSDLFDEDGILQTKYRDKLEGVYFPKLNFELDYFHAEQISKSSQILRFGHKISLLKWKNDDSTHIDFGEKFKNNLFDPKFKEFFYILYIDFSKRINQISSTILKYEYTDKRNFLKKYISDFDYYNLRFGILDEYHTLVKGGNFRQAISDLRKSIEYRIDYECDAEIWKNTCFLENDPIGYINRDKKLMVDLNVKRTTTDMIPKETVIFLKSWYSLIRYEFLTALIKNRICENVECRRLLSTSNSKVRYCQDDLECKKLRDRKRQKKSYFKRDGG